MVFSSNSARRIPRRSDARLYDHHRATARYVAAALVTRYGGRYVLRGGAAATLLEGSWGNGAAVLISEWPDLDTLQRFWNSEDYREVKRLREGLADVQVLAVESRGFS
jgi:uncharacterized protein (DUF1330 family)